MAAIYELGEQLTALSVQEIPDDLAAEVIKAHATFLSGLRTTIHAALAPVLLNQRLQYQDLPPIVRQIKDQLVQEFKERIQPNPTITWWDTIAHFVGKISSMWASSQNEAEKIVTSDAFLQALARLPSYQQAANLFPNIASFIDQKTEEDAKKLKQILETLTVDQLEKMIADDAKFFDAITCEHLTEPVRFLPPDTLSVNLSTAIAYIKSKCRENCEIYPDGQIVFANSSIDNPFIRMPITHVIEDERTKYHLCLHKVSIIEKIIQEIETDPDDQEFVHEINCLKLIGAEERLKARGFLKSYFEGLGRSLLVGKVIEEVYCEKVKKSLVDSSEPCMDKVLTSGQQSVREKLETLVQMIKSVLMQQHALFIDKKFFQEVTLLFQDPRIHALTTFQSQGVWSQILI